jgi:hypothetical protein
MEHEAMQFQEVRSCRQGVDEVSDKDCEEVKVEGVTLGSKQSDSNPRPYHNLMGNDLLNSICVSYSLFTR